MTVEEWLGKDNTLGIDIWNKKYRRNNESFDEWLDRVSGGCEDVRQLIVEKKFLFGGRILSNRGVDDREEHTSLSNCYVITPPDDSIESIYETCSKLARTYSYGGGCGIDISKLSPAGARVHNQAKSTSGAVSFMDTFSQVTEQIGQNGRRGALMISISCTHPDLEKFITVKSDLGKVTSANISVRVTDDFMRAVEEDKDWELSFTRPETNETITKTVKAKDIYHLLCKNNWDYAEPGILFWDRIEQYNLLSNNDEFRYAGTNPCAEEPLPAGGSCLLGAINLAEFVDKNGDFALEDFSNTVRIAVDALNDVLDEGMSKHPLEEQRNSVRDWRQIGLGIMGLADMLIKMGITYGSEGSLELCDSIGWALAHEAISTSQFLAGQDGAYPKFDRRVYDTDFYRTHCDGSYARLRNSQLLTIAPTGTISTMIGVSGGIEPIFANSYTRMTKSLHGHDEAYKIYTPIVKDYMTSHKLTDESELPDYFVTSATIPIDHRIKMQGIWQRHIDASISSTVNLPHEATVEDVERLYMAAWKKGLKGVTVYRAGCARDGILTTNTKTEEPNVELTKQLARGDWKPKPADTVYYTRKLYIGCGSLKLFIGWSESDHAIQDFYIIKSGEGGCERLEQSTAIAMSAVLRLGGTIRNIEKAFRGVGTCSSFTSARSKGKKLSKGNSCGMVILNTLKEFEAEMNGEHPSTPPITPKRVEPITKVDTEVSGKKCPNCGAPMSNEGGCVTCKFCGESPCG